MSDGSRYLDHTESADEVEVAIYTAANGDGAGGVIALKFFGLSSDSPTA